MTAADLMTLAWAALLLAAGLAGYGLGRLHERDRARAAPVVPLRRGYTSSRPVSSLRPPPSGPAPGGNGASQVRIVAAPRAYDWRNDDGGVG